MQRFCRLPEGEYPTRRERGDRDGDRNAARKVECRQPSLMRTCYFGRFYSESVLSVSLPAEWQTVRVSDGEEYRILRDGTQVGRIYETDKEPEHTGNCLEHAQEQNYSGIVTETCILRDGTYGDCGYMRREIRHALSGL